jgi:hypothetical protein
MIALYGSWKTFDDQGKWSIYIDPNKICKINLLILVSSHWYVTSLICDILIIKHTVLKYLHNLIAYVTRFSIGWKIGVILCHPTKKSICDVYAQTSHNIQAP